MHKEGCSRGCSRSCCQGHEIRITASLGVHTIAPGAIDDMDAALAIADRALYAANANGRDCVKTSISAA